MRSHVSAALCAAIVGLASAAVAAPALAGTTWAENANFNSFGGPPPAGAKEFYQGFGTLWDINGRTVANAEITTNTVDPGNLTQIQPKLWQNTDADLFQIQIVDPANFSASVNTATTPILALFSSDGTALAASRGGGTANAITGAGIPGLTPGLYYIGIGATDARPSNPAPILGVPRNNAGQALFDFSTDGVKAPLTLSDMKLSTDPRTSWTVFYNQTYIIGDSNFTVAGAQINLTGADFAVTPEPASAMLLALTGAFALRRRARGGRA